ncbi:MAG: hypothetical protein AB1Z67_06095 [Candidatus Limnocylindrales bacterium]
MDTSLTHATITRRTRAAIALVLLSLALVGGPWSSAAAAQDASAEPTSSPTPAEAACASVSDLRVIVGFIDESLEDEAGLVPLAIGVLAGVSEARRLVDLVGEVYRPLTEELLFSLQGLRDTLGALEDLQTGGARLAAVAGSVEEIGLALDALTVQLRTGCPE